MRALPLILFGALVCLVSCEQQGRDEQVRNRFRITSEYEGDVDFVPKAYPPFNRRDSSDAIKPDEIFDSLISNITTSTFDRILTISWNGTRTNNVMCQEVPNTYQARHYNTPSSDVTAIRAQSTLFESAGNITRVGYSSAAEVQGNSNELIVTGHIRIPVPRITINVEAWDKENTQTSVDVTAVSARDVIMTVQFIVNKQWKKVFVTSITPKDNVVFRSNFKCDGDKSFDFCKQVQDVINREVLTRLDSSLRDALKFKLEEVELDV